MIAEERAERINYLRERLTKEFDGVKVWTNDDMNPATPIVARVTWPGQRTHTFRAWTLRQTKEELASDAIAFLAKQRARD